MDTENQLNQIPEELKEQHNKISDELDGLHKESDDFNTITRKLNDPYETNLGSTAASVKNNEENLEGLVQTHKEVETTLRDKTRELFNQDLEIEDKNRELQKHDKDHHDTVQYKEEIYSKYHNNQERALKDLKIQYEGIDQFIKEYTRLNKDTENLEELVKHLGFDKTEELLAEKSKAPYDELKLKENLREIAELRQQIDLVFKADDGGSLSSIKTRLIEARAKENELQSKFEIYSNYKILNTEIKEDVEAKQEELRIQQKEEQALRQQNEELERLLQQKKQESQSLLDNIKLAEQLVDAHSG
ncbi:unnamed protein product [Moneuplotes crassus]|uniref:Uncharacterized protein n=1 Tax=Euplotes crassus TaxID=5936 RepID=A0AAD1XGP2_EUPCR|nr:unnamed protein product [Moneuplotes crassus]